MIVVDVDAMKLEEIHGNGAVRSPGCRYAGDRLICTEFRGERGFHGGLPGTSCLDQRSIDIEQKNVHKIPIKPGLYRRLRREQFSRVGFQLAANFW